MRGQVWVSKNNESIRWVYLSAYEVCFTPRVTSTGRWDVAIVRLASSEHAQQFIDMCKPGPDVMLPADLAGYVIGQGRKVRYLVPGLGSVRRYPGQAHAEKLFSTSPFCQRDGRSQSFLKRAAAVDPWIFPNDPLDEITRVQLFALQAHKLLERAGGQQ